MSVFRFVITLAISALILTAGINADAGAFDQLIKILGDGFSSSTTPEPESAEIQSSPLPEQGGIDRPPQADELPDDVAYLVKPEAEHEPGSFIFEPVYIGFWQKEKEPVKIPFMEIVKKESQEQGADLELIFAVIQAESAFDPKAKSKAGAIGLMQVLPGTARWLGLKDGAKLWDPAINVRYGVKYMKYLWGEFGEGDFSSLAVADIEKIPVVKTIAAYNCGPGNVKKHNGVPPFKETRKYVKRVSEYFRMYEDLMGKPEIYAARIEKISGQ